MNRQSIKDFQGTEITPYAIITVDTSHYKFVQTHRIYTTKNELSCKVWTLSNNHVQVHQL